MKFDLYRIDWRDAAGANSWHWIPDLKAKHYDVNTVGWLVYEDKDYYVLTMCISSEYQAGERMQIPKKWVTKVKKIKGQTVEFQHGRH